VSIAPVDSESSLPSVNVDFFHQSPSPDTAHSMADDNQRDKPVGELAMCLVS